MPRVLSRAGPAFKIEGRTIERAATNLELLETVDVRLSMWKEKRGAQRWVSMELTTGTRAGLEIFVPIEVLQGEGVEDSPPVGAVLLE